MLHNQSTTQSEVVELSGDVEAVVVARGRVEARPLVGFLKDQGVHARVFDDADAAFEEVLVHRPHLVLVDEDVPPEGGIGLCQRLKRNTRTHFVPAILFAHRDDKEDRLRAFEAGVDAIFLPEMDVREQRTRMWALLRTQAIYRRQESKQRSAGSEIQERRRWFGAFVHDLQNSIAALRANFDYLTQAARSPSVFNATETEDCVRDGEAIFRELVRGFRTVLSYDGLEAGKLALQPAPLRLGELARSVKADLEWQAEVGGKTITLDVGGRAEDVFQGDRELLKQALESLVGHTLRQKGVRAVSVKIRSTPGGVKACIGGDGPLAADGNPELLFEPFARPRPGVREGHGLGLALWVDRGVPGGVFALELKSEEGPPKLRSLE
jgi:DNA-binding response OmpR family regulator